MHKWVQETVESARLRAVQLIAGNVPVVIHVYSPTELIWRQVSAGERKWDRHPEEDGLDIPGVPAKKRPANKLGNSTYPWDEWLDGEWHVAFPGEEFVCRTDTFKTQLRQAASKMGMRCSIFTIPAPSQYDHEKPAIGFRIYPRTDTRRPNEDDMILATKNRYYAYPLKGVELLPRKG